MTTHCRPTYIPKGLGDVAARKARRLKRRIILAKDGEGEVRLMSVPEFNRATVRGKELTRLCTVNPMGVFS